MAKIPEMFDRVTQFFSEALTRIFSPPVDKDYPEIGVQPFEGDSYKKSSKGSEL
jgi:hypothetical protein